MIEDHIQRIIKMLYTQFEIDAKVYSHLKVMINSFLHINQQEFSTKGAIDLAGAIFQENSNKQ